MPLGPRDDRRMLLTLRAARMLDYADRGRGGRDGTDLALVEQAATTVTNTRGPSERPFLDKRGATILPTACYARHRKLLWLLQERATRMTGK